MPTPLVRMADATAAGLVVIKRMVVRSGRKGALPSSDEAHQHEQAERSVEELMQSTLEQQGDQRVQQHENQPAEIETPAAQAAVVAAPPPAATPTPPGAVTAAPAPVEAKEVAAASAEVKPAEVAAVAPYVNGTNPPLESKVYELEMGLAACSAIMGKLGNSVSPWDIKSHHRQVIEAKGQLDSSRASAKHVMQELLKESAYTKDAGPKLREREVLLEVTKDQEAALQRTAQAHAAHSAKYRAMLVKIDQGKLARLESRGAAGGRFAATGGEETLNMLVNAVDVLVEEHRETLQINAQLERSKEDLSKRVKELQDKMRSEVEVRERELQQLRATVKKANEEKEAGVSAAKEQATVQLAKRTAELKALQHRTEVSKSEAEQAKAQNKTLKAALDQANEALSQSQEESKALAKKLQVAKSQKEGALRELEHAKAEQSVVHTELRQLQAAAGAVKLNPSFLNKDAAWPRVAFTLRGGKVLHNSACGNIDTSKCTTFEYFSCNELESHMQKEGIVLCHTCRADPRF